MLPVLIIQRIQKNMKGFNHLNDISGSVEETNLLYIIRDR